MYASPHVDQFLNNPDGFNSSAHYNSLPSNMRNQSYETESTEVTDPSSFDLFSQNTFDSQRYRTNASSSSSVSPVSYNGNPYPPSYGDAYVTSSYDMMNGVSSAYSSGKVSPLTPSDSMTNVASGFAAGNIGLAKEYSNDAHFQEIVSDRRHYPEYTDDYGLSSTQNRLSYSTPSVHPYQDHAERYSDGHFPIDNSENNLSSTIPSINSVGIPHGIQALPTTEFRSEGATAFDNSSQFFTPEPSMDLPTHMPDVDQNLSRMRLQNPTAFDISADSQPSVAPFFEEYVRTSDRLAFGERTVIVMSSKVAQKSYGTEKRFLCPPPTAILLGNSWWSHSTNHCEEQKPIPPRVIVSISGEPIPQEGNLEWTTAAGKSFDASDPPSNTSYIGRSVGKQLYISDVDEKKKKVEALVKVMAPASAGDPERVIGTFPSRPIKVISKPSKKRQSAKNLELCINHGSPISLFHRLRSQTVSTKYLCVSGSGASFKGSDGAPLMGLDQRTRSTTPSFIARTASWDPFVMYIVDVNKPANGIDTPPPPPPQADYPSPPPNAIPFTNNGSQIPIYYNQTVVLQCLTSGVVSPVLIIRKVDHQTTVVGGGLQEGAKPVAGHYCALGEVCGDPVSQLHKVAFEVYESEKTMPEPGNPGISGTFLSCMGEKVNTYRPIEGRQWSMPTGTISPGIPSSPVAPTPTSSAGSFYHHTLNSAPSSPTLLTGDIFSNDGGRVRKKRSTSSAGTGKGVTKGRRPGSSSSVTSLGKRGPISDGGSSSGALWQVDTGETSIWTIVGVDQIRYNFYVPPILQGSLTSSSTPFSAPFKPVTPFPSVVKYLPPDRAAEVPKSNCATSRHAMTKPHPHAAKMLTFYGENFVKDEPVGVYFGLEPSPYVEVRCTEVLGCLPPESQSTRRRPVMLVRSDGVVFPSNVMYP